MIKNKEDLKIKIEKIFTKIRNKINDREEELFLEIDELYDKIYIKEDLIKNSENLPNEIRIYMEKGRSIDKEWNEEDNKLRSLINECINIENIICNISQLNQNLKKAELYNDLEIKFSPEDNEMNYFLEIIKNFGYIYF